MARSCTRLTRALCLASLCAWSAIGHADPPAPSGEGVFLSPKLDLEGPEAEAKDRARELFKRGVEAYRTGRFYEAVDIFLETQRMYPDTQLCFNIARAYENLDNPSAALRYYRDYLRQADRPSDGEQVRERVRGLERRLAERGVQQLTVLSQPEAATVLLDGRAVGVTPWTGETYPGKHRLALTLDAYQRQEQVLELAPHTAQDISLVLLPEPRPPAAPVAPTLPPPAEPPAVSLKTWVTLGAGLALLGGALVSEAGSKEPGMSPTTAFLSGGGLGVGTVGSVMLYFDLAPKGAPLPLREKDSAAARRE